MIKYSKKRGENFMKVDYIEIRESVLPKSIGARYKKGALKHFAIFLTIFLTSAVSILYIAHLFPESAKIWAEIFMATAAVIIISLESLYMDYIKKHFLEQSYKVHWNYDRFSKTLAQYDIDDPDAFAKNVEVLENYFRFRGNETERRDEINRLLGIFYGENEAKEDDEKLLGMLSRGDADGK